MVQNFTLPPLLRAAIRLRPPRQASQLHADFKDAAARKSVDRCHGTLAGMPGKYAGIFYLAVTKGMRYRHGFAMPAA